MSTAALPVTGMSDEEFLTEVNRLTQSYVSRETNALREEFRADMQRFRQSLSRGPSNGAPDLGAFQRRPSVGLAADTKFAGWLASSRTRKSSFACELPFEIKAVTPITGVGLPYPYTQLVGAPQLPLRLAQVMFHVPVTSGAVTFTEETNFTPGADIVPETALKPGTALAFANKTATVATIATIAKASVQSINDTPQLAAWIDERLSYAVLLRQEQYILNDPTTGLLTLASAAEAPPTGATMLDAIALAIGQLSAIGYTPDAVTMNPSDVTAMRLVKDTTGRFLWASPDSAIGTSAVWNLPLVSSPACPQGTFLVGAFMQSTILFDRQILTVEISYENEDDFIHNLACFRAELRCAAAVPLPLGLVKGSFVAGVQSSQQPPVQHAKK
jgi:hypothetical protein